MAAKVGFLDEDVGIRSSTRLLEFILAGVVVGLAVTMCVIGLKSDPKPEVLTRFVEAISAVVIHGIVAVVNRTKTDGTEGEKQ